MLYLLDAGVLIRAHQDYYGLEQVPQFWEWLLKVAAAGDAKIPFEIHDEIACGNDALAAWIRQGHVKEALILAEEVQPDFLEQVLNQYGGSPFIDSDLEKMGRDLSKPSRTGANRHVPDVCNSLGIKPMKDFDFFRALGFTTK